MTYHWLSGSIDTFAFPGSAVALLNTTQTIPANGTLKKFLLRNIAIGFLQAGSNQTNLGIWTHNVIVQFNSGPYNGRVIWQSHRKVDYRPTVFHDPVSITTSYTGFASDGDFEHAIDQKTSYGGAGKAASGLQCLTSLSMHTAAMSSSVTNFHYSAQFLALYSL